MMTLEQFRSPQFAELLSKRYVDWMISYHAGIFRALVANGELRNEDPDTLAWMYVSPIIVLLSVCDRQPEREAESLAKLDAHVRLFFRTFHIEGGESGKLSSNRVAADDNPMKLMSIAMKPLCSPPFPLDYLEEMTAVMGGDGRMR